MGGLPFCPFLCFFREHIHMAKSKRKSTNWLVKEIHKEQSERKRDAHFAAIEQKNKSGPVVYLNPKTFAVQEKAITKDRAKYVSSDKFLESYEWRSKRMEALKLHGARCQCCGATPKDGVRMHVDHIKPRKTHPALALDLDNLQVLCEVCNHGKGNWDSTDWRKSNV